jgi:hypothetical protein
MLTSPNERPPKFLENACDATRILSKRRQLYDINENVAVEKEKFDRQCLILQQKEDELTKRELNFQAKVRELDLDSFLSPMPLLLSRGSLLCMRHHNLLLNPSKLAQFDSANRENAPKQAELKRR